MITGTMLNIALVLVAAAATLSAFGGETYVKGEAPLVRRITPRGWVSVVCLAVSVGLGVAKEIVTHSEGEKEHVERTALNTQLEDARSTLGSVSSELTRTQSQLAQEAEVNLVSALAEHSIGGANLVFLSPSNGRYLFKSIEALFPAIPKIYRDVLHAEIEFSPFSGSDGRLDLTYDHDKVVEKYNPEIPEGIGINEILRPELLTLPCDVEKKSMDFQLSLNEFGCPAGSTVVRVYAPITLPNVYADAAAGYSSLRGGGSSIRISLRFEREFGTELAMRDFMREYSALPVAKSGKVQKLFGLTTVSRYVVEYQIPQALREQLEGYWTGARRTARMSLYIGKDESLILYCDSEMKLSTPSAGQSEIQVVAIPRCTPSVGVTSSSDSSLLLRFPRVTPKVAHPQSARQSRAQPVHETQSK